MTIAFLFRSRKDFYFNCFKKIALKHPEQLFYAICIDSFVESDFQLQNVKTICVKGTESFYLLNKYRIFRLLQNIHADWFFTDSDYYFKQNKFKQIVSIDDNTNPAKRRMANLIQHAMVVIAHNEYLKKRLLNYWHEVLEKIEVLPIGIAPDLNKIHLADRTSEIVNPEMNYFLINGIGSHIDSLKVCLKAFSIFKKWQKSTIHLIVYHDIKDEKEWKQFVLNYTYKEEIVFVYDSYEKYIKSCYATIFIAKKRPIIYDFLMAIDNSTLILLPNTDYYKSIAKDSSLYFDDNEQDLSEKMMRIYKREDENKLIIRAAQEFKKQLDWDLISDKLWSIFMSFNKR